MRASIDIRQRVQASRTPAAPRVALGAAAARRCAPAITRPSYNGAGAAVRRLVQTPKTAAVESPAIVAEPLPAPKQPEQFNWYKNWYPAALLESLQPDKPNALQLLGLDLVAWRTPEGEWSVLEDACPHRLAPLSEGRLHSDGTLMCSYHGWTFDGKGACKSIPQMADPKALATATGSARACVKRYPSQELFGILWVWAEAGPTAWIESAATTPTSLAPDLLSGDWVPKGTWFQRDVPVSFDTLVENVVDPSHVQFSHHGVIGDRGAPAQAAASIVGDITCKGGFTVGYNGIGQRVENVVFSPPSSSRWHFPGDVHLQLFATPTRVGWTRVFVNMIGDKNSPNKRPPNDQLPLFVRIMITVIDSVPWLQHPLQHNKILDGDDYFLHKAERRLYKQGSHESWPKQYYMPGSVDAGVIGWRRWLDDFGSALPVLPRSAADLGPVLPKREMFDRYEQHTKDCPHCLVALRNINIAIGVLAAVAAVSLGAVVAAAVTGAAPLLSPFCAKAGAAGAVAAAVVAGLLKFRQLFIYYEYDHSEH